MPPELDKVDREDSTVLKWRHGDHHITADMHQAEAKSALPAVYIYVMYKLRFCTSCNLYRFLVQVATCTSSIFYQMFNLF